MFKIPRHAGRRRALARMNTSPYRRPTCEWLEDRRMLSLGDLLQTLNNPTPGTSDYFGLSVSVSGNTVVVGAPYDNTGATDAGSAR